MVDLSSKVKQNRWLFHDRYNSISDYFRETNITKWWKPEQEQKQQEKLKGITEWIKELKPETVLEIGPGTGRFTKELISISPHVTGIELNEHQFKKLIHLYPKVNFIAGDVTTIALKGSFDLIMCIDVLVHISDIPGLFFKFKSWGKSLICDITPVEWYKNYNKRGTVHRGIDSKEFENMISDFGTVQKQKDFIDENGIVQYKVYQIIF